MQKGKQLGSYRNFKLNIISALHFTLIKVNPDYLPLFSIFVDYIDTNKTEIYIGDINSIGIKPRSKLLTSTNDKELYYEFFRIIFTTDNEMDAVRMGLRYSIIKTVINLGPTYSIN